VITTYSGLGIPQFSGDGGPASAAGLWWPRTLVAAPGGMLYVECPNVEAPFTARQRLFHQAHTYNFTLSSLTMLARSCGFELQHSFGRPRDGNLAAAFRSVKPCPVAIDPLNRPDTLAAIAAATPLRHNLRSGYLQQRFRKVVGYVHEWLTAAAEVRGIMRACSATPAVAAMHRERRAAA
jgi:hypothetical protein